MANFDRLFCINDSGFFFLETGQKIMILCVVNDVGPKRNNHHGFDKRSSTYVDTANCNEVFFPPGQIPSLWRRWPWQSRSLFRFCVSW